MRISHILKELSEANGVSGYEKNAVEITAKYLEPYVDEVKVDKFGNLVSLKRGKGNIQIEGDKGGRSKNKVKRPVVYLAAHLDEIGLMVTGVDKKGFIRFTTVGGFDPRTLRGQLVTVHGTGEYPGVVGTTPPHLLDEKERKSEAKTEDMYIDIGLDASAIRNAVKVGDIISVHRDFIFMKDSNYMCGKALDNRVGAAVLIYAARELDRIEHEADVYFVGTAQEEVGTRGAVVSAYSVMPHIGIALDVCHGDMPGVGEEDTFVLGKGVAIAVGPNIHPLLAEELQNTARKRRIPFRTDPTPGPTPTDARAIQITAEGIPSALLSVPLRYMHTSVEMVNAADIRYAGRLLGAIVGSVNNDFIEKIKDYG